MEFIVRKDDIVSAVSTVVRAIVVKCDTNPLLQGIYIKGKGNKIKLIGSDLNITIETIISGQIISEGELVVCGKLFYEIIKKMPGNVIHLEVKKENLIIKSLQTELDLAILSGENYPKIPAIKENISVEVSQRVLRDLVKGTSFAAATTDERPVLKGILVSIENSVLELVAFNNTVMAIKKETVSVGKDLKISALVDSKNFSELSKLFKSDNNVTIKLTDNQMLFEFSNTKILVRLLEGTYFRYSDLIPKKYDLIIELNKIEFHNAIERAVLLGKNDKFSAINFLFKNDEIIISSNASMGKIVDKIKINNIDSQFSISLNTKHVIECLKSINDDKVFLKFNSNTSPCIIENKNYFYLISPVRKY